MFFDSKTYLTITYPIQTDRHHCQLQQEAFRLWFEKFGFERKDCFAAEFYDLYNQWVRGETTKRGKPLLEFQSD